MAKAIEAYLKENSSMRPYLIEQAAGVGRGIVYDILARRKVRVYLDTWLKIKKVLDNS